ncbi:autotransporter domain-containing protein [Pyruvatibacter sp.]|uniref:autotransporter outer membrane beta-barrel domain-containing protein n=1 Tax=Pyruvatibacter sp. TaxID=1981328 RepID=UPI0032667EDD
MKSGFRAAFGGVAGLGMAAVFGAAMMTASATPAVAQSATSCNGGNVAVFNRTAPAGGAANVNQAGTFFVGDVITATATGLILSVAFDVNPGSNLLLFLNNTTGSGSFTFPSSGTFTITGAVNAQGGGSGSVGFTCVSGPGAGAAAGGGDLTPRQTTTVTDNAHQSTLTIEEQLEQEMIEHDRRLEEEYENRFGDTAPPEFIPVSDEERPGMEQRLAELRQREHELEKELEPYDFQIQNAEDARDEYIRRRTEGDTERNKGAERARALFGIDVDEQRGFRRRMNAFIAEASDKIAELNSESFERREELKAVQEEIRETFNALERGRPNPEALGNFTGAPVMDRFDRDFQSIVRHFDEQNPDNASLPPVSARAALDKKTIAWVRASYTDFSQDDASRQEGETIMIGAGVHRAFWEDIKIGVFATTAWSDTKSSVNNLKVDSRSYSAGLYGSYLVEGLTLSARASYGWSDSDIRVTTSTGSYDADKFSVSLSASGIEPLNSVVWVRHTTSLSSTWSQRDAYTNSLGTVVGSTDTWGGRVSLGPTIGMTLDKTETFDIIEPSLGLIGSYTFSNRDSQGGQVPSSESDYFGLAVAPGLTFATHGGSSLSLSTQYFGIGSDISGWTVGGTLSVPFN